MTSTQFQGAITFKYEDGILTELANKAELSTEQLAFISSHCPFTVHQLEYLLGTSKTLQVKLVPADLDFDTFWDTYGYKVGVKSMAAEAWKKLSEAEKIQCLESIPAYNYYLMQRPNMERLYPTTYLRQKRFETDYKALVKKKQNS